VNDGYRIIPSWATMTIDPDRKGPSASHAQAQSVAVAQARGEAEAQCRFGSVF